MARLTQVFGWLEVGLALYAAVICGKGIFAIATSSADDLTLEWAPLVIALTLPISLSLGWGGWHLIWRQDWLHQAVPLFVFLTAAGFMFALDY